MLRNSVHRSRVAALALIAALGAPAALSAQAVIKVNDDVSFRFGVLLQSWVDFAQTAGTPAAPDVNDGYQQNIFLRRMRLLFGGQVAKNVTFFVETDVPNYGRATGGVKTPATMSLQDAYLEWRFAEGQYLDVGQIFMPLCRNCIQSAASLLAIDYGPYTFTQSGVTESFVGRDVGLMLKGYLIGNLVEYRAGVFSGARDNPTVATDPGARNALRSTGRLMVNFLEPEVGNFYTGTYLGKRRVANVGVGYDVQGTYNAFAVDGFLDHPLTPAVALTAQVGATWWDGDTRFPGLSKQMTTLAEAGLYFPATKLLPFVQFSSQGFDAAANRPRDQTRMQVGLGWFSAGHNANIKAGWGRINPDTGDPANAYTLQFQAFYY